MAFRTYNRAAHNRYAKTCALGGPAIDREQFVEEAIKTVPPEYHQYARQAVQWVADELGSHRQYFRYVSPLAAELTRAAESAKDTDPLLRFPIVPEDIVNSEIIADWAKPWAESVRQEVFGSPDPPFTSLTDAAAWIKEEEQTSRPESNLLRKELRDWEKKVVTEGRELQKRGMTFDFKVTVSRPVLAFPGTGDWVERAAANWSPKLRKLVRAAEGIADATGWQDAQVTAFLLIGMTPLVSRLRLNPEMKATKGEHGQGQLIRTWINVEIRGADFKFGDLKRLFRTIREYNVAQKYRLKDEAAKVWLFVREYHHIQGHTWPETLNEWLRTFPESRKRSIRALQSAYKKANDRGPAEVNLLPTGGIDNG